METVVGFHRLMSYVLHALDYRDTLRSATWVVSRLRCDTALSETGSATWWHRAAVVKLL